MRVSAIVPIYNAEGLLVEGRLPCFESLLSQIGGVDVEVIAVDDCSTDGSYHNILLRYSEVIGGSFVALQTQHNVRAGGARNLGLSRATGDWITFVDQDDYVATDFASRLCAAGDSEGADMVGCFWDVAEHHDGEPARTNHVPYESQVGELSVPKRKSIMVDTGGLLSKLFRREVLESAMSDDRVFPEGIAYEDNAAFNEILMAANKYAFVPEPLYFYRSADGSVTHTLSRQMMLDRLSAERISLEAARRGGYFDRYFEELEYIASFRMYMNTTMMVLRSEWDKEDKMTFMSALYDEFSGLFPRFRCNKYYRERMTRKQKAFAFLQGLSPRYVSVLYARFL